jgi:hypothetical protein
MDCPHARVIHDPDPDDCFCDDDVAVVCVLTSNPKRKSRSRHKADESEFRTITVACRPYNTRKEANTPSWCPLPPALRR